MTRHWAINGRFLTQSLTGVQRYAMEILRALDSLLSADPVLARGLEVELLAPPGGDIPPLNSIRGRTVGTLSGHAWEQFALPAHVRGGLLSLCNTGPVAVRKQILCIHDANTRAYPRSYSVPFRLLYRLLPPMLGHRVALVATVSRYSADELARWGIAWRGSVAVIPNGHEHARRWQPRHSDRTQAAAGADTIVVIGSAIPHKNTQLIVGMADRLAEAGIRIAVVGRCDARVYAAGQSALPASVLPLGPLSDEELAALLKDCLCLAFPSLVEGFGLPPLEAMAIGCPVVASDRASMPEICADAVLYASPLDADAWFSRFRQLQNDPGLRHTLIARGRKRALRFQWERSARQYLERMAMLDGMPVAFDVESRTCATERAEPPGRC